MPQVASTRWCPTPEQLMILEEMYRGGIRTPNASQIQQITAHLSFYGRIEGKNVFYWFQNHKARDRQKLRRRLIRQQQQQQNQQQQTQQQMEDSAAAIRLPNENPPQFLHQGALEDTTNQVNFTCQTNIWKKEGMEMGNPAMAYGQDWVVMMDVCPTKCCRPLKTLELFPIKSTGLKEEFKSSKPFPCSTSTN
ncbi:hypothetical protein MRB53_022492 [Persea americana]|uniref:Uncharacterized protein n=1 Tax=Persea americana TaxID=3435 RepID=A0ACC2L6U4_PERAE|nr:hypothetical protein MRB53_022492 [Persea americana]